ncbi:MAG: HNH endonuclease [Phycisphaerales bacterium]
MPRLPPRPCRHPGCPGLVDPSSGSRVCPRHGAVDGLPGVSDPRGPAWGGDRGSAHSRGYGARWRRLRRIILARDPVCRVCQASPAVTVDHLVPKAEGGGDDEGNLQGLCAACHTRKTQRDAGRARARATATRAGAPRRSPR